MTTKKKPAKPKAEKSQIRKGWREAFKSDKRPLKKDEKVDDFVNEFDKAEWVWESSISEVMQKFSRKNLELAPVRSKDSKQRKIRI